MAVRIRLTRRGSKKHPFYRIVAADSQMPRDGRFLEIVGTYDPFVKSQEEGVHLKDERVAYWLGVGALPSDTVKSLFRNNGFYKRQAPSKAQPAVEASAES